MQPTMFNLDSRQPVYYSLDYPNTIEFSPEAMKIKIKFRILYILNL